MSRAASRPIDEHHRARHSVQQPAGDRPINRNQARVNGHVAE
jgi:hypothetical protein